MKERETILKSLVMLAFILVALVGFAFVLRDKKTSINPSNTNQNPTPETDAMKFKKEYEAYNNKEREDDLGHYFQELNIPEDNPMKYVTAKEAVDILDHGTGILYFGYPTCPWCRNAVPVLMDAVKESNFKNIYYLNVNLYKNVYAIQDGEVVKIKEEKEGYYDLLKALDNVLEPFTLQGPDGKIYEIGEKRIYVPMMVFVKNGKIIGTHVGTVTLEGSQTKYDALKENQYKELFKIYEDYIAEISENDYCDEDC